MSSYQNDVNHMMQMPLHAASILNQLWAELGGAPSALQHVQVQGMTPILPSTLACDALAQACIAASGLAAAQWWRQHSGQSQTVQVDSLHAVAECRSERYLLINQTAAPDPWDPLAGIYRCKNDRWVRIHTNFAHHRDGVLALLHCANDKTAVANTLKDWDAFEFEQAATDAGMVVAAMRTPDEWAVHPQQHVLAQQPLVNIERIGDAPRNPWHQRMRVERPLQGLRVLDLTRVIAGPVSTRTLAAHGADVLHVSSPQLPFIPSLVMDTHRGKRACYADLKNAAGRHTLQRLVQDTDVFVQAYRPGALDALGFGAQALTQIRPGIVVGSLSAYGHSGPWALKRGFDSLVQTAVGFNAMQMQDFGQDTPRVLPMQILDHASGYLMACGIMQALQRQASEGGSWHVQVSLARTAHWLNQLGRIDANLTHLKNLSEPTAQTIAALSYETPSGWGQMTAIQHAARLSKTPAHWSLPSMPLGTHEACWI